MCVWSVNHVGMFSQISPFKEGETDQPERNTKRISLPTSEDHRMTSKRRCLMYYGFFPFDRIPTLIL